MLQRGQVSWARARLVVAVLVLVAGGSLAAADGIRTRAAVEEARRQNRALRAQQEALQEQAFDLARRLFEDLERGRLVGRGGPDERVGGGASAVPCGCSAGSAELFLPTPRFRSQVVNALPGGKAMD